jgi:hypothetical protein
LFRITALRLLCFALSLVYAPGFLNAAEPSSGLDWRARVESSLPLFGHRNWILIVDSAYPLQVAPGIETIDTGASQTEVLHFVLSAVNRAPHVRPDVFLDAELPYISDQDAPGVSAYRDDLAAILREFPTHSLAHDKLIANVNEAGQAFHVLVLKTTMTIPYSSVFVRLNCRYWSDDAETRLRQKMAGPKH